MTPIVTGTDSAFASTYNKKAEQTVLKVESELSEMERSAPGKDTLPP